MNGPDGGLFAEPDRREPDPPRVARRARWQAAVDHGQHPLAVALRTSIPLHPDAVASLDPADGGPRCGGCGWRAVVDGGHAGRFPKCVIDGMLRVTNGPGTDVRRYWPACAQFDPQARIVDGAGPVD